MVQGLTEQSGGRIGITSKQGVGTTISLLLPAADPDASLAADEPAAPAAVGAPTRNLTVLAVDDDALVLMNTTMMLEELGHTVIEAYNGAEALDVLRNGTQTIDIVITDHSMPRMTGSELAAEVRRDWPTIPVVLATGYAELPSGGDARLPRLPKPFSQSQLQDAITSVLKGTALSARG